MLAPLLMVDVVGLARVARDFALSGDCGVIGLGVCAAACAAVLGTVRERRFHRTGVGGMAWCG